MEANRKVLVRKILGWVCVSPVVLVLGIYTYVDPMIRALVGAMALAALFTVGLYLIRDT